MTERESIQPNSNGHNLPATVPSLDYRSLNFDLAGSEVFSLHRYWEMLRNRRATILTVTVIVTILAVLYALKTKPVYQATAKVEVDADIPPLQRANDQSSEDAGVGGAYLQTQVDILKSNDLAWQTIQQFGLEKASQSSSAHASANGSTLADARKQRSALLAAFEGHLQVHLAEGSHIILVSYESTDPSLAERIPNALVDHYLEYNFTAKYDSTRRVSNWMAKELDDLKAKVVQSQQALVTYEKKNDIADVSNRGGLAQNALSALSGQLTAAEVDLSSKKGLFNAVQRDPSAAGLLTKDPLLSSLQGKYGDLETAYVKGLAQYGPNFYKVVQIRKQLDEVNLLIQQEQKREEAQAQADYEASRQQVNILNQAVNERKTEVEKLNELAIPYNILKNEYQTNQQLYQNLLQNLKDAEVSAGLRATNVHVLDQAVYPVAPIRPRKSVDIAAGLLSGLLLGITLAFVQEGLDTSVRLPEDVENVIGAPVLGFIPQAGSLPGGRRRLARRQNGTRAPIALSVSKQPNSPLAEAYRALRTSVLLSCEPHPPQIILFTSTQPREGKTSTCANLALSLAQLNKQVLLIDADMRQGQVQNIFTLPRKEGLSDFLTGRAVLEDVLMQTEEEPSLWVIPSGSRPHSPADLCSSRVMDHMVREFRKRFEFILVDSPPLLLVTDATILSKLADGIILVTASDVTARKALMRAQRILETAGQKILGAVVNRIDIRRDGEYDYYRNHYHYYSQGPQYGPPVSGSIIDEPKI